MINQDRVKELFNYNPESGDFKRAITVSNNAMKGALAGFKNGDGYNCIEIDGTSYRSARIAWLYCHGEFPNGCIDHVNGIRDDDRLLNLRDVSHGENMRNRCISSNNTSGVMGVHWDKDRCKWRACISLNGKLIGPGRFKTKEEAASSRMKAELKYGFHKNHGRSKVVNDF